MPSIGPTPTPTRIRFPQKQRPLVVSLDLSSLAHPATTRSTQTAVHALGQSAVFTAHGRTCGLSLGVARTGTDNKSRLRGRGGALWDSRPHLSPAHEASVPAGRLRLGAWSFSVRSLLWRSL